MSERVVTAHIPGDLARDVDRLAEQLDRPRGWIVKAALERFVDLEKKRHRLTEEALADVDAGRTVDHAEVEAWVSGLVRSKKRRG